MLNNIYDKKYLIIMIVKQGGIKYHFWVFGMTRPGIEHQPPGPLANNGPVNCNIVVGDSPMTRIMDLPKENLNQELSW